MTTGAETQVQVFTPADVLRVAYGFAPNPGQADLFGQEGSVSMIAPLAGQTTAAVCLLLSHAATHPGDFCLAVVCDFDRQLDLIRRLSFAAERLGVLDEVRLPQMTVWLTNGAWIECFGPDPRRLRLLVSSLAVADGAKAMDRGTVDALGATGRRGRLVLLP